MTNIENIDHLAVLPRWVLWGYSVVNGRKTKVPYQRDGSKASTDDPTTWARLSELRDAVHKFDGVGVVLGEGLGGVDLDACIDQDGALEPWAEEIIDRLDTYAETSPSGRGIKLLLRYDGEAGKGSSVQWGEPVPMPDGDGKSREIALFTRGRYFTVTRRVWSDKPIRTVSDADLVWLRGRIEAQRQQKAKPKSKTQKVTTYTPSELHPDLMALIRDGVPQGERSNQFMHACGWLKQSGYSEGQALALLQQYPDGIAQKYADRLEQEVARVWPSLKEKTTTTDRLVGGFLSMLKEVADPTVEPEPLRAKLTSAQPYPVEMLGSVLGAAAKAIQESTKAPLALCAQSVLGAASLVAQAHFDVQTPWGQRRPVSLFLLTVGVSGERKSGVDDEVMGSLSHAEKLASDLYKLEMEEYSQELAAWQKATDSARTAATTGKKGTATAMEIRRAVESVGDKPSKPINPQRFVTDPTVEGLFRMFNEGQPSLGLFSDEGGLIIGGHAMNSDNALKTFARLTKLWDGAAFDRVRGGDEIGKLYHRRIALHLLAQPEVMVKLLSDRMANGQGFLARCLVAWPESTIGSRHIEQFMSTAQCPEVVAMQRIFTDLITAQPRTSEHNSQELDPLMLLCTPKAHELAIAAHNQFETLMGKGNDLAELQDRAAKALENALRIAAVLTAIEHGLSARHIDADQLVRALSLVQWYLAEALRIRGAAAVPQATLDAEELSRWLGERDIRQFRTRMVLNAGPLRNKERLGAAINVLVDGGYITPNEPGTLVDGARARKSWTVVHHVV